MFSPPLSPKFRTRSPSNPSPPPQEAAAPNPESFYQGLESSMDQVDFDRFFAKFPFESDISKFFENFPLSAFHVVMVEALKNVLPSEYDSPQVHPTRRARLVLERELRILDGVLGVMHDVELQVTDTRDELRRLNSQVQGLMGEEIPVEVDSSNPVHPTAANVDYGTVDAGSWATQVHNSPSRGVHSISIPSSYMGYPTIPFSPMGYPTITPSFLGYPMIPPSSVRYPTIPPSSVMYPTIPPSSVSFMPMPSMQPSQRPPLAGFHDMPTPSEHHSHNSTSIVLNRYRTDSLHSRPEDAAQAFRSETYSVRHNPRNNSSSRRRW